MDSRASSGAADDAAGGVQRHWLLGRQTWRWRCSSGCRSWRPCCWRSATPGLPTRSTRRTSSSATSGRSARTSCSARSWNTALTRSAAWSGTDAMYGFIGSPELGYKVAFCERDVAIYLAVLLAGLAYGRFRDRLPSLGHALATALLILPMAARRLHPVVRLAREHGRAADADRARCSGSPASG